MILTLRFPPSFRRIFHLGEYRFDPERDVSEEIGFYLEERIRELEAEGLTPQQARRIAEKFFGDRRRIEAECRRIRQLEIRRRQRKEHMDILIRDLRFAFRHLRRQPFFTGLILLMLAVGIAGNTVVFSLINAVFLRPFPYEAPERLVNLDYEAPDWNLDYVGVTEAGFLTWREQNETFDAMGVFTNGQFALLGDEGAELVGGMRASWDLQATLGLQPVLGRLMMPEDDVLGGPDVVLLTESFWRDRFAADPAVVGRSLTLDARPHTVIGVLPDEAALGDDTRIWVPLHPDPDRGGSYYLYGIGRLREGVSPQEAQADLRRIHQARVEEGEASRSAFPIVTDIREREVGDIRLGTYVLWGAVLVLLLIACINVASLMLARAVARGREFGVRAALGAGRSPIVRQLLTESLLLALAGGILGVLLGIVGLWVLPTVLPLHLPVWVDFSLDGRVLLVSLAICLGTALLFGLAPALRASSRQLQNLLADQTQRATFGSGRRRLLNAFVAGELALALTLLILTGLMIRTYDNIWRVDPGFEPKGLLSFYVTLPEETYPGGASQLAFFERLVERIQAIPGVTAAGASTVGPMRGHNGSFFEAEGAEPLQPGEQNPVTLTRFVTVGYTETLGVRLKWGRFLQPEDGRTGDAPAVVVNETFARHHWGEENPIGRRIRMSGSDGPWWPVVGVTYDLLQYGLDQPMRPGVFAPVTANPHDTMCLAVRTGGDPVDLVPDLRAAVREQDRTLPLIGVETATETMVGRMSFRRAYSQLLGLFAGIALLLALGGIYGVVAYAVNQRRREIGIRIALGADRRSVLGLVLRQGLWMIGLGSLIGIGLAALAARGLAEMLYQVDPLDPGVYALVVALLLVVAAAANVVPALRATRTDPVEALRLE
jgi:predicted permease